ncbi:MAG TPA: hemerythrin domain-containing protein [Terriglobales bacterium]
MLRDRNLVPLSHQHQRVLALCVRLDRAIHAGPIDLESWQQEIHETFEREVCVHFEAEEKIVFPVAGQITKLQVVVAELRSEHEELRVLFAKAAQRDLRTEHLQQFVEKLARHIRKEERELFEGMQHEMDAERLAEIGAALDQALRAASRVCSMRKPR